MKVVTNMNTLKSMQKHGVVFCNQTGSRITGLYGGKSFVCYYVDEAPYYFVYKGRQYGQKYFDGCFFPYVVEFENEDCEYKS